MWIKWNPNPCQRNVGDCAVRAVAAALDLTWVEAYDMLAEAGRAMCDMPSSDAIWGAVLRAHGFRRHGVPDRCPECYTAEDFARERNRGIYTLGFGGHTCTIRDGRILDSWDSRMEIPQFYWHKEE